MLKTLVAIALVTAAPATAWEFTADPICTLSHRMEGADITVTYDPLVPEYTIALTRAGAPWPRAPAFGMQFTGPRGLFISTDRHVLSDGDATLSVTDSGFGNVLNGLQYNGTATAVTGDSVLEIPLAGAAEPVAAFRACADALAV